MQKSNLHVGRDGMGRVILDLTRMENPAISVRFTFKSPEEMMRIADELSEHSNDMQTNKVAYPECFSGEDL